MRSDVEMARRYLQEGYSVAAVKHGVLLGALNDRGVKPFIGLFLRLGAQLEGSSVADRVVGRAVALVAVSAGCACVHGNLMAETAVDLLREHGTAFSFERLVPVILDRTGTRSCPVERLSHGVTDIGGLLRLLRGFWGGLPGEHENLEGV